MIIILMTVCTVLAQQKHHISQVFTTMQFSSPFFWNNVLHYWVIVALFQGSIVVSSSVDKCPMNNKQSTFGR